MLTTERQFRIAQVFCVLVVLACLQVALKVDKTSPEITPIQWILVAMGVWAIFSGFLLERQIVNYPKRVRRPSARSTPFSRWRAGNLIRIASATSVALWGLILRENGGPTSIAYIFFAIAILLLLAWKPSVCPVDLTAPHP
jgi:uncharacterized membrane protein